jgi:UDP:flavonoid glycosyltransferase YjiC (YdhE family)
MRFLFASTHGAGHFGPLVPLARACERAGHEVLVAAPPKLAPAVEAAGFDYWPVADPPADELAAVWPRVPALPIDEQNRIVIGEVFGRLNGTATLPGHREAIRRWAPDLVVREICEYGSALAAELEGVPHVRVGFGLVETEELALGVVAPVLDELRAAAGLRPDPQADALRRTPYLTWTPESLEAADVPVPPETVRLRDPAWDATITPLRKWWPAIDPDAPLVYVTFGTVAGASPGAARVYTAAMEAVADLPVRALLTVGRDIDLEQLPAAPSNVRVERWVPQGEVLPHAAAVVCHAGSGSTLGALAAGLPLVCIPLFADQPYNARRVAASGAGLSAAPDAAAIRSAVARVLREPFFGVRTQRVALEMRRHRRVSAAVELLVDRARGALDEAA